MRIVIDTNVITSAIFFGGKPLNLLHLITSNEVEAVYSKEIADEYTKILERIHQKYPALNKGIDFDVLLKQMECVECVSNVKVCRDPDDDKFIQCALDGNCIFIVSGDKDLLTLEEYEGIKILTVNQFLESFNISLQASY